MSVLIVEHIVGSKWTYRVRSDGKSLPDTPMVGDFPSAIAARSEGERMWPGIRVLELPIIAGNHYRTYDGRVVFTVERKGYDHVLVLMLPDASKAGEIKAATGESLAEEDSRNDIICEATSEEVDATSLPAPAVTATPVHAPHPHAAVLEHISSGKPYVLQYRGAGDLSPAEWTDVRDSDRPSKRIDDLVYGRLTFEFRIKPATIRLGDREVTAPVRGRLDTERNYWWLNSANGQIEPIHPNEIVSVRIMGVFESRNDAMQYRDALTAVLVGEQ